MEWSPLTAYCVGLITTDGNLSPDRRHIEFTSKDLELVEYVRACFGPHNQIGTKSRGEGTQRYFRVQFGNVRLYRWLCTLGLSPRKSLTLGTLEIPDRFFINFLRGHLDGDGTIIVYWDSVFPNSLRCYVRFCSASRPHLDWLETTISRLWSIHGYQTVNTRAFRLSYAKRASVELLKRLYASPDAPCLLRKRQIAAPFIGIQAEVVKLANTRVSEARAARLGGSTPPLRIEFPS